MPFIPNFLERLAIRMNIVPSAYLDIFGVSIYKAITLALKFDVFESVKTGPQTAKELASKIVGDERATRILLEMLEAFGYVRNIDGRFANTSMTAKWLLEGPKGSFSDVFKLWRELFEFWSAHEEEVLRNGRPRVTLYEWFNQHPESWRTFQHEEMWYARLAGGEIAAKLKMPPGASKLLDVGGGHGLYSVTLCRRHPNLSATVFDQPKTLEYTKEVIATEKMSSRVSTWAGDFLVDDLGSDYDVVLLFNIIHGQLPEANQELLRRVGKALRPKGMLVILDQFAGGEFGKILKASNRFWGLAYLTLLGGQVYSTDEVRGWLSSSGFSDIRRASIRRVGSSLLMGRKATPREA
jgi:SAM-dependent methyltransferase